MIAWVIIIVHEVSMLSIKIVGFVLTALLSFMVLCLLCILHKEHQQWKEAYRSDC